MDNFKRKTRVPLEVLMVVYPTIGIQSKNKKEAKKLFKKLKNKHNK